MKNNHNNNQVYNLEPGDRVRIRSDAPAHAGIEATFEYCAEKTDSSCWRPSDCGSHAVLTTYSPERMFSSEKTIIIVRTEYLEILYRRRDVSVDETS